MEKFTISGTLSKFSAWRNAATSSDSPVQVYRNPHQHDQELDDEDETIRQLKDCAQIYLDLQNCLISTNRDWKACQKEVRLLKICNEKKVNSAAGPGGTGSEFVKETSLSDGINVEINQKTV